MLLLVFFKWKLPNGFFALIAASATSGSDSPSSLMAVTRNKYSSPSSNPVTSNFGGSISPETFPIWLNKWSRHEIHLFRNKKLKKDIITRIFFDSTQKFYIWKTFFWKLNIYFIRWMKVKRHEVSQSWSIRTRDDDKHFL